MRLGECNQVYCGIQKARQEKVSENPCWSRSLEGLGTLGRLSLEGLLLFVYPNLLSSGSIYYLEGDREVFHRVLRFPLR